MADKIPVIDATSGVNADWLHVAAPRSMAKDILISQLGRVPTEAEIDAWLSTNPKPGGEHGQRVELEGAGPSGGPGKDVLLVAESFDGRLLLVRTAEQESLPDDAKKFVRVWKRDEKVYYPLQDEVSARLEAERWVPAPRVEPRRLAKEWNESKEVQREANKPGA